MNVKVISDVHLEFDHPGETFDPGTGDILVLAGDIIPAAEYGDEAHEFFIKCVEGYNRVFYVLGNHEHYGGNFNDTLTTLQEKLPLGVTIMNNRSECVDGVHFIGGTLWTNFNNLDLETMETARECMNDYHLVDEFSPEVALEEHMTTREWFDRCIPTLRGPVFVITHHAPSTKSVKGRYVGSEGMYSTDMASLIRKHPNILYWAHGHVHATSDYMVEQCRVIANPRGYNHMELNPNFNLAHGLDINPDECQNSTID